MSKCAAGRSIFAHAYIQLERYFSFFSSQALSNSNVIMKLHSIDEGVTNFHFIVALAQESELDFW